MALTRAIDDAHAAAADLLEDFVIAEAPVLVRQIHFRQKFAQRAGIAFVGRLESGSK
jgi:hypothetical protein